MIKRIVINALALAVATLVLPGITLVAGEQYKGILTVKGALTLLGVAIIFGVVNAVVKPLFKVLTGCVVMLTFGLFLFVINGAMMLLVSWICTHFGLAWQITGAMSDWHTWLTAIEGGVIVAVVSFLAAKFLKDHK